MLWPRTIVMSAKQLSKCNDFSSNNVLENVGQDIDGFWFIKHKFCTIFYFLSNYPSYRLPADLKLTSGTRTES